MRRMRSTATVLLTLANAEHHVRLQPDSIENENVNDLHSGQHFEAFYGLFNEIDCKVSTVNVDLVYVDARFQREAEFCILRASGTRRAFPLQ